METFRAFLFVFTLCLRRGLHQRHQRDIHKRGSSRSWCVFRTKSSGCWSGSCERSVSHCTFCKIREPKV